MFLTHLVDDARDFSWVGGTCDDPFFMTKHSDGDLVRKQIKDKAVYNPLLKIKKTH